MLGGGGGPPPPGGLPGGMFPGGLPGGPAGFPLAGGAVDHSVRKIQPNLLRCRCGGRLDLAVQEDLVGPTGGIQLAAGAEGSARNAGGAKAKAKAKSKAKAKAKAKPKTTKASGKGNKNNAPPPGGVRSYILSCNNHACGALHMIPNRGMLAEKTLSAETSAPGQEFSCPICSNGVLRMKNNTTGTSQHTSALRTPTSASSPTSSLVSSIAVATSRA